MSDARPEGLARRFKTALAAWLGAWLVRLLAVTWRVRVHGPEVRLQTRATGEPVVLAMWHGELLPLVWYYRGKGIAPLISTHADGEIIARICESLGYEPIRGSSSRGGARALLEAVRVLGERRDVAFTTDGPRGPRRQSAPGVGMAAAKAGAAVVPVGVEVDRKWQLQSWDGFVIPKPFARVTVRYAAALRAGGSRSEQGAALVPAIDAALLQVCGVDVA